jgi:hypothetical protein
MLKPLDVFKFGLLSVILTLGTGMAQAKKSVRFLTAAELHASLLSTDENVRFSGRNYIMGVLDTLMLTKDAPICFADQTEINVLVDTVQAQLLQRPDLLKYNAASVVREVMVANYPCI